jgi:hypothetical protein
MPQITIELNDNLYQELSELCAAKGQSPKDTLEILLIAPISDAYFAEIVAPRDYFLEPAPVTRQDTATALREVAQPILDIVRGSKLRPEAIIHGLIRAAYEQALALCNGKGLRNPEQHADLLFSQMIQADEQARHG